MTDENQEPQAKNRAGKSDCLPRLVRWWVCSLDRYGMPDWKTADGPHDNRKECEETIALLKRLACIEKKERVICEVRIYDGKESIEGLNQDAIDTLNSISPNVKSDS